MEKKSLRANQNLEKKNKTYKARGNASELVMIVQFCI